jgi:hypothetical protein
VIKDTPTSLAAILSEGMEVTPHTKHRSIPVGIALISISGPRALIVGNPGSAVQAIPRAGWIRDQKENEPSTGRQFARGRREMPAPCRRPPGVRLKSGRTLASSRFLKGFFRGSNRPRISSGSGRYDNRVRTGDLLITHQLLNQLGYAGFSSRLSIRSVSGFRAQWLVSEDTKAEMCGGGSARIGNEFHNRMRSTSLSVISSFVRS